MMPVKPSQQATTTPKPDFEKFLNQRVTVALQGGREGTVAVLQILFSAVTGIVRGYDPTNNLVLDETVEYLRSEQPLCLCSFSLSLDLDNEVTTRERHLGILVVRGLTIESFCPAESVEEISNPYN